MRGLPAYCVVGLVVAIAIDCAVEAGVLLDYGYVESFGDAAVVRGEGGEAFGFSQYQSFYVADEAWRIDSVTVRLRLFDAVSSGDVEIAVYNADGLLPDLTGPIAPGVSAGVGSMSTAAVSVDLGGIVFGTGEYYIGLRAVDPATNVLWMPGETPAARHAVRSDGRVFTWYNPALSMTIAGEVVPAPAGVLLLAGVGVFRRRR